MEKDPTNWIHILNKNTDECKKQKKMMKKAKFSSEKLKREQCECESEKKSNFGQQQQQ